MILLDAVGTVIYPHPSVARVYADVGRRFGSQISESQIAKRFQATFDDTFRRHPPLGVAEDSEAGERDERERWRSVVAKVLDDVPAADTQPFEVLWEHFAQPSAWRVFEDATALLDALNEWQIPFGIASNFDRRLYSIMHSLCGIDEESIFVSSILGAMKPDAEFYRRVLQQLGLMAHEVLMIGDDWAKDFHAAREVGLRASCVRRSAGENRSYPVEAEEPPARVDSLRDLIPWLHKQLSPGDTV